MEHTLHDKNGNLLECTTEEHIGNIKHFKKYDGQCNLLDEWQEEIIKTSLMSLDEYKDFMINHLKESCNQTILSGFDYNNEHYNLDYEDQINMEAIKNNLLLGLMTECEYYPAGEPCRVYSKEEYLGLYSTGMSFKTANIQRCKALIEQVENATTKEEINLIEW